MLICQKTNRTRYKKRRKTILIGVPYALLDMIDFNQLQLNNTIIMETGGMKGRRKEM